MDYLYADVIVDISADQLDKSFQYKIPEGIRDRIRTGMVVRISFGSGNRERKGYVIALGNQAKYDVNKMKFLLDICTDEETTESHLIALAGWMKNTYGSTMIQALKTVLPVREKAKMRRKRFIRLLLSEDEAKALADQLESGRSKAKARLLRALISENPMDYTRAQKEYHATSTMLSAMERDSQIEIKDQENKLPWDDLTIPASHEEASPDPQQRAALDAIFKEWQTPAPRPVLVHGITGSGKTIIYMELIERVIREGRDVIVLIPEISLTFQTICRFRARFGDMVSFLNSRLTPGQRYQQFRMARQGSIRIMVGPRSALFTPFSNLGLIIIDEEHESSYKSEYTPRYHARETAIERSALENAHIVMGSATPSMEAYHRGILGEYLLLTLKNRYRDRALPKAVAIDMKQELKEGNRSILSRALKDAMTERLKRGEQTILFLNRRGYAGFISCRSCGYVVKCPHCDVSLNEHIYGGRRLVCHYCGYEQAEVFACPKCGSPYIGGFKAGTQQVEQSLSKILPAARVLRMDSDTTRNKGDHEKILNAFAHQEADILLGTQMIVKGHDFPNVTLVGVIAADLSLNDSDYRCAERTCQLITQAAGRAGRGQKEGIAIIQTYNPDHYSIRAALNQDYEAFYREEIRYRELMAYPPSACMLAIIAQEEAENHLIRAMEYINKYIRRIYPGQDLHIIGPAPAAVGKVNDMYRRVLYLKHSDDRVLKWIREKTEQYLEINSGFDNIYIQFDKT